MGRGDRRLSLKMRRRASQKRYQARIKRRREEARKARANA